MSASEQLRQLMLRLGGEIDSHDLEQLRVPDSNAAEAADALAAEGQPVTLTNHGLRSYGFGALLGIPGTARKTRTTSNRCCSPTARASTSAVGAWTTSHRRPSRHFSTRRRA